MSGEGRGFLLFGLAALLVAVLLAPPGPIQGAPGRYHGVTATTRAHPRSQPADATTRATP